MRTAIKLAVVSLAVASMSFAQFASDNAADSEYDSDWAGGQNGGFGFTAWTVSAGTGGTFTDDGQENPAVRTNDINTGGRALGMWNGGGDPAVVTDAVRGFDTGVWQDGRTLTFDLSFRFDDGNRGVNLYDGVDEIFFFNISDTGYAWSDSGSASQTDWADEREFGEVISFSFTQNGANVDFVISSLNPSGPTGSGSVGGELETFRLYSAAESGGDGNNTYLNNFEVIPEPGTMALLGLGLLGIAGMRRRLK